MVIWEGLSPTPNPPKFFSVYDLDSSYEKYQQTLYELITLPRRSFEVIKFKI